MIYLDTHVVVWLYSGLSDRLSPPAKTAINDHDLLISPIVRLELQYLHEIGRLTVDSKTILTSLAQRIDLQVCDKPFDTVVQQATTQAWTRDTFDCIIVAQDALNGDPLPTKDVNILHHYPQAIW